MKKTLALLLSFTMTLTVYGNGGDDNLEMRDILNGVLKPLAEQSGYHLEEDFSNFDRNWYMVPPILVVSAVLRGAYSWLAWRNGYRNGPPKMAVTLGVVEGLILGGIGSFWYLSRSRLNYRVVAEDTGRILSGHCVYFYSEGQNKIFFEIDGCSHNDIFPQTEDGILRIGRKVDSIDRMFGQNLVVAYGVAEVIID